MVRPPDPDFQKKVLAADLARRNELAAYSNFSYLGTFHHFTALYECKECFSVVNNWTDHAKWHIDQERQTDVIPG